MGLRFFHRVRLAPGLTLNLSKRGASLSVGSRGIHFTTGTHGLRETVGIPGTGLSYSMIQRPRRRRAAKHVSTIGSLLFTVLLYPLGHSVLHLLGVAG